MNFEELGFSGCYLIYCRCRVNAFGRGSTIVVQCCSVGGRVALGPPEMAARGCPEGGDQEAHGLRIGGGS